MIEMEHRNKMGALARCGAFFIAISSSFAVVSASFGLVIDGFEVVTIVGMLVAVAFAYIFGVIGFTGHPPKILNWTR